MAGSIKGITIQIGADTTKLTTALSQAEKSIKSTQTQLSAVEKALKMDPGNIDLLRDKQGLLAAKIQETKEKLDTLKEAQRQMDASGVDKNSEEYRALQTEIDLTESKLKGLTKEMDNFGSAGAQAIAAAGKKVEAFGNGMARVGDTMTRRVTTPILGVGAAAVKITADFDSSMSNVAAISGATGEDFEALRAKAREMGSQTKFSASEAADAMSYMAMAGWKTNDMLEGVSGIMNLAAASGEELATTSDIVTDALTAFGLTASDSGHFADVLAATAANANTNVSMMGESFKYCAPTAGALGYSIEDVSVAIGLMGNSGIKASQAGTSLNNIFTRMAKEPKEAEAAMNRLGLSLYDGEGRMYSFKEIMEQMRGAFGQINMPISEFNDQVAELDAQLEDGSITQSKYDKQLEELIKQAYGAEGAEKARAAAMLAGQRGMSGLLAIVNASDDDWNKLNNAVGTASDTMVKTADGSIIPLSEALASGAEIVEEYEGQAAAMAAVMQDNLGGQATILKSQLEELAISFGDILMPTIRNIVSKIQEFVDKLNNMDEGTRQMIIKAALFAAALGPVLSVGGRLLVGAGKLMQFAPQITGAVTKLAGVFSGAAGGAGGLGGALGALASPVGIAVAAIAALAAMVVTLWKNNEDFRNKITAMWAEVTATFDEATSGILEAINSLGFDFQSVGEAISAAWTFLCNSFAPLFEGVFKEITTMLRGAMQSIQGIIQLFCGIINGDWDQAWTGIKNIALGVFNTLTAPLQGILTAITEMFASQGIDIKQKMSDMANSVKTKLTETATNVKNKAVEMYTNVTTKLSDMANSVRTKIGEMRDAWNNSNLGITVSAVWGVIKKTATDSMTAIKNAYEAHGGGMKGIAAASMEAVKQRITLGWNFADNFTGGKLSAIANTVQTKMTAVKDTVSQKLENVKQFFTSKLTAVAAFVDQKLTAIYNFFSAKLTAIADFVSQKLEAVKNYFTTKLEAARAAVDAKLTAIYNFFSAKLTAIADFVSQKLEAVKNYFNSKLEAARSYADTKLTAIYNFFSTKLTAAADVASQKLELVKNYFSSKLENARSTVDSKLSDIKGKFDSKMGEMASKVSEKMEAIRKAFADKIQAAHDAVAEVIAKIKKLFDITLKLDIKLPHISVDGGEAPYGIGGKGKLPSFDVKWYDHGGIFDSPSVIGVGEKRPEFVGALDDLRQIVREESGAGAGSELLQQMQLMTTYMAEMLREITGVRPIQVTQEIYANETSYSEQQKAAAREFKAIARTI